MQFSKLSKMLKAFLSRNLIEKPEEAEVKKENCISMVQCKVMKQLELLEQRKFEDEDIQEDISFLMEKMNESVQVIIAVITFSHLNSILYCMIDDFQDLSSYDEYVTEVRSGRLEWSPVHRSEKFWRENAAKLNDKNYELLRILITLLESTKEPLVLSVACFDLGKAANILRLKIKQSIFSDKENM